jgi:CRP-like cAMP-binding protein
MPEPVTRGDISNSILKRCSESDFGLLHPHLETVGLPVRKTLEARNRRIRTIYFMESGFASVVANGATQPSTEVGLIGREGMSGLAVVLGADRPIHETFMQVAGTGLCLAADSLRRAIDQSSSLHRELLKAAYAFQTQVTQTALANGRSKIEERLARWLLMADDRLDGDELPLTHEFLSLMLGVQRSGVTLAVQALEADGLIAARRGRISILNRAKLEKKSNDTYTPSN